MPLPNNEPSWIPCDIVNKIHARQIELDGGKAGILNQGSLESALGRPKHRYAYGERNLCTLAAAYGFGIVRNHPYLDGNKRTAFVTVKTFLEGNGFDIVADEKDAEKVMLDLARGDLDQAGFADWLKRNTIKLGFAQTRSD